jgi:hypothetical protein
MKSGTLIIGAALVAFLVYRARGAAKAPGTGQGTAAAASGADSPLPVAVRVPEPQAAPLQLSGERAGYARPENPLEMW